MSEHAPTTEEVRSLYKHPYIESFGPSRGIEFDRWLAQVEREAAARALEEAAAALKRPSEGAAYEVWAYGGGDWLRSRAA
ncbi:hypothetical protein, partial [Leucobacter chromiisoli]|uniref:hypothetical protein n=1 Tax=Leucobacter chromiisoli TaxID=2796471 RepID=UPI001F42D1D1